MIEIGSLQVQGICNIVINDTSNCNAVAIELTDDLNHTLVLNHEFLFDQINGLPNGMSWQRAGNEIEIVLGNFSADTIWKARIRLRDNSNNWTAWDQFILN